MTLLAAALLLGQGAPALPHSVPRSKVFPVESLTAEEQALADEWLLAMLDREGLYTLVGGLKPMSSGWMSVDTRKGLDSIEVERAQRIARTLRVGSLITSAVLPYARAREGRRSLEGHVFHTGSFREAVARQQRLFSAFGITPSMPPAEAVLSFEHDGSSDRFRAYGHLFGYPDHAVDFFARAADQQEADPQKKLVPRRFLSIPTFRLPTNAFVYAVPVDHVEREEDRALREAALPILASYRARRAKWITKEGRGAVQLMRDWMCRSDDACSPEIAREKALAESSS